MKKFTKIIIGFSASGIVLLLVFFIIVSTIAMGILAGADYKKDMQEKDEDSIEHFEITGTANGNNHNLNFIFSSWKIEGIKANLNGKSGNIKVSVKIPDISGSNEQIVYQVLRKNGYSHAATCGIMGNIWAESGFNPCAIEGENSWTRGRSDRARGYGLCQWTNSSFPHIRGRRTNAVNWLKSHGYDPYKKSGKLVQGQIKYMLVEPGYEGIRSAVKNETNIDVATEMWLRKFEGIFNVSTYNARRKMAVKYSKHFANFETGDSKDKMVSAILDVSFEQKGTHITFSGTLDSIPIAGNYYIKGSSISGNGEYGEGASAEGNGGFSGTLSDANAKQKKVVFAALSYKDPYSQGYAHMCELWVYDVYRKAGLNYRGSCCASHSRDMNANRNGKIPIGAAIYSGNSYRSTVRCNCGRNAGHVAIYIGNGQVLGSQVPFKMTLSQWQRMFGYGGWYFPK